MKKIQDVVTYWTLDHWRWFNEFGFQLATLHQRRVKVKDRWIFLLRRWVLDGKPGVSIQDDAGINAFATHAQVELDIWKDLIRLSSDLSIRREKIVSVAVLVRSILSHYMCKEDANAFARRCFEDIPAPSNHKKTEVQGVA